MTESETLSLFLDTWVCQQWSRFKQPLAILPILLLFWPGLTTRLDALRCMLAYSPIPLLLQCTFATFACRPFSAGCELRGLVLSCHEVLHLPQCSLMDHPLRAIGCSSCMCVTRSGAPWRPLGHESIRELIVGVGNTRPVFCLQMWHRGIATTATFMSRHRPPTIYSNPLPVYSPIQAARFPSATHHLLPCSSLILCFSSSLASFSSFSSFGVLSSPSRGFRFPHHICSGFGRSGKYAHRASVQGTHRSLVGQMHHERTELLNGAMLGQAGALRDFIRSPCSGIGLNL
mmetsp:Transcript_34971/g.52623  ORF Transcript_34971/g.52623 Transcript_34971/m.52623 type:complete len:288 (-) Transcript_34971:57-920(-)